MIFEKNPTEFYLFTLSHRFQSTAYGMYVYQKLLAVDTVIG